MITDGKLLYTLDTLNSYVFEVFISISFLISQLDFRCTFQKFQVRDKLVNINVTN